MWVVVIIVKYTVVYITIVCLDGTLASFKLCLISVYIVIYSLSSSLMEHYNAFHNTTGQSLITHYLQSTANIYIIVNNSSYANDLVLLRSNNFKYAILN